MRTTSTVRRIVSLSLLAAVATGGLAACGKKDNEREELLDAVRRTQRLSSQYIYSDERFDNPLANTNGGRLEVQGIREDDFRFKARVLFNDADGFDEVVADDLLAMRMLDPTRLTPLVNKERAASSDLSTEVAGVNSLQALESRRWVIDEAAAPSITSGARSEAELGRDPVLDALTALAYVERAIEQSFGVNKFDPDDLSPAFSRSEDTFPKPSQDSQIERYDLLRPFLPPPGTQSGSGDIALPQTQHFRRMAVYVKDDRVVQVRESVDLLGKKLDDFIKYYRTFLKENKVSGQIIQAFEEFARRRPTVVEDEPAYGRMLLYQLNLGLQGLGETPVLVRNMSIDLRQLGGAITVDLPQTDVIKGNLDFLVVSDRGKEKPKAAGAAGAGGRSTGTNTGTGGGTGDTGGTGGAGDTGGAGAGGG